MRSQTNLNSSSLKTGNTSKIVSAQRAKSSNPLRVFFASINSTVFFIICTTSDRVCSGKYLSAVRIFVPSFHAVSLVVLNSPVLEIVLKLVSTWCFWSCLLWSREDSLPLVRDSELDCFDCLLFIAVCFVV